MFLPKSLQPEKEKAISNIDKKPDINLKTRICVDMLLILIFVFLITLLWKALKLK